MRADVKTVKSRILSATLLLLLALFLAGCPMVDTKELNYTRTKPKKEYLIGTWTPDKETIQDIRTRGHYPEAIHEIILREDGTFSIINMPDWWNNGFGESGGKFISMDGRWSLKEEKDIWTIWVISLETPKEVVGSFNVYHQKPPYSIFVRVGDPNNGKAMIFDRTGTSLK
jgi:hypothetical protein